MAYKAYDPQRNLEGEKDENSSHLKKQKQMSTRRD